MIISNNTLHLPLPRHTQQMLTELIYLTLSLSNMKRLMIFLLLLVMLSWSVYAQVKVSPILECVIERGPNDFVAFFGYNNPNNFTVNLSIGNENKFTPAPQNQGQPTLFDPGRTPYYPNAHFSVDFDGSNLVWSLNGKTSTASQSSTRCPAFCGNSIIEAGEPCDDGNNETGDGCDAQCQIECDDADQDNVCDDVDDCKNSNSPVNENGCDHMQFCNSFSCSPECFVAEFEPNGDVAYVDQFEMGCKLVSHESNGIPQRPICVPQEYNYCPVDQLV